MSILRTRSRRFGLAGPIVLLALATVLASCTPQEAPDAELRSAIEEALPAMERFELVEVDDGPIVEELEGLVSSGAAGPVYVDLPVLRADGSIGEKTWTAYHVDVRREFLFNEGLPEAVQMSPVQPEGPSRTFRGIPEMTLEEIELMVDQPPDELNESEIQPSVLNLVGDGFEGAYYGNPESEAVQVIEKIDSLLQPHVGTDEARRLAALSDANYLVYRQQDYQPPVEHGEIPAPEVIGLDTHGEPADADGDAVRDTTADVHATSPFETVHPVMVADSTVYDPDTDTWLVSNWFDRVDAAANRQDAYLLFSNIGSDVPSSTSDLAVDNNRLLMRTEIAGYLVLTEYGKTQISYPSNTCGGSGSFVDVVRQLSTSTPNAENEYWMWWTKQYGGGCAYISTVHRDPNDYAVGWSGYGGGSTDWTSFVFMHESGHILGGTHQTNAAGSPETYDSHRCTIFGFWEVGPTGPSLMSYASGTRTSCFAVTDSDGVPKKNLTKSAEFLHSVLN
ncbi:MAG: M12 family metallo-peptidase [Trueperaceae bacterium]|nr:M12 family metallo-peptidase [Trueperaceae bacterium]